MRDHIVIYVNGKSIKVEGESVFIPLSSFLRENLGLTGSKIVCSEGDCGACTVIQGCLSPDNNKFNFQAINSCIVPLFLLDCSLIVTIEGLRKKADDDYNPIQQSMIDHHGSQCGLCTPGFVMSLASMFYHKNTVTTKEIKNYLTGNLCRCTGYTGIINAAKSVNPQMVKELLDEYQDNIILNELKEYSFIPVKIKWNEYSLLSPVKVEDALKSKKENPQLTLFGSATDLGVYLNKKQGPIKDYLNLSMLRELYRLEEQNGIVVVGAKVSISKFQKFIRDKIPDWAQLFDIFASPQIKNMATLVGNLAGASPIGDTIPYLLIADCLIEVQSYNQKRFIKINDFFKSYKQTELKDDEIIVCIHIPIQSQEQFLRCYKVSKRRDLDISTINGAFLLDLDDKRKIKDIRISLGGVAATPLRLLTIEKQFKNLVWNEETISKINEEIQKKITPISDVRGSDKYRRLLVSRLIQKFYFESLEKYNVEKKV